MNMMASAGPYGGPYSQSAGQGLPGGGLGPQLQNKAGLPNNMANQFNMDKKTAPGQGMPGMVGFFSIPILFRWENSVAIIEATCIILDNGNSISEFLILKKLNALSKTPFGTNCPFYILSETRKCFIFCCICRFKITASVSSG